MNKKVKLMLLIGAVFLLLGACTKTKEPEQKPETLVVPEISTIPFETITLTEAPTVVKKMAHSMSEQDFITWTSVNDDGYVIVYPGLNSKNGAVEIDKIEQRIPDENHSWLNVKLKYTNDQSQTEPIVAKFALTNTPKAMGFQLANNKKLPQISKELPKQKEKQETKKKSGNEVNLDLENVQPETTEEAQEDKVEIRKGPALRITEPASAEAVSTPIKITGVIASKNGDVTVRIKNDSGQVLAEKPVNVDGTEFETSLNFTPPKEQQQGFIEAVLLDSKDHVEISRVSVGVILMP